MIWFVFALLTAFFESLKDVASKRSLGKVSEYVVAWSLMFFSAIFLVPIALYVGMPKLELNFWIILVVSGVLHTIATILYMKAIKYSDLSVTTPLLTFTPLFLLITSPLIINEFPAPLGIAGMVLIVAGAYSLKIKSRKDGYLMPFKALLGQKGPRLMLAVAFLWSITANLDKIGIVKSSTFFWIAAMTSLLSATLLPIMIAKTSSPFSQIKTNLKYIFPIGLFNSITLIFHMLAISLTLVAYVIAIKRTSVIMNVLWGHFFFKEKDAGERLMGSIMMILGVVLITVS